MLGNVNYICNKAVCRCIGSSPSPFYGWWIGVQGIEYSATDPRLFLLPVKLTVDWYSLPRLNLTCWLGQPLIELPKTSFTHKKCPSQRRNTRCKKFLNESGWTRGNHFGLCGWSRFSILGSLMVIYGAGLIGWPVEVTWRLLGTSWVATQLLSQQFDGLSVREENTKYSPYPVGVWHPVICVPFSCWWV